MTNDFEKTIRNDLPIPPPRSGMVKVMRKMDVGHSIMVPKRLSKSIQMCAKRAGIKVRQQTEDHGVLVWRIE